MVVALMPFVDRDFCRQQSGNQRAAFGSYQLAGRADPKDLQEPIKRCLIDLMKSKILDQKDSVGGQNPYGSIYGLVERLNMMQRAREQNGINDIRIKIGPSRLECRHARPSGPGNAFRITVKARYMMAEFLECRCELPLAAANFENLGSLRNEPGSERQSMFRRHINWFFHILAPRGRPFCKLKR